MRVAGARDILRRRAVLERDRRLVAVIKQVGSSERRHREQGRRGKQGEREGGKEGSVSALPHARNVVESQQTHIMSPAADATM